MKSRDFVYWLQGFFEISGATSLNEQQTEQIKKHLKLVFAHEIDPAMGDKAHQDKLNAVHGVGGPGGGGSGGILLRC